MTDHPTGEPRTHGVCIEHDSPAEFHGDGSASCLYCCVVETSCRCTEAAPSGPPTVPNRIQYAHGGGRFYRDDDLLLADYFDRETGDLIERAFKREAAAPPEPPRPDLRAAIGYATHLMEQARDVAAPAHVIAIQKHIDALRSAAPEGQPLDVTLPDALHWHAVHHRDALPCNEKCAPDILARLAEKDGER